jgi:beta-glucanase (GH16 family)
MQSMPIFRLLLLVLAPSLCFAVERPQQPTGLEVAQSSVNWEWAAVTDAVQYEVTVDGHVMGTTIETQYLSSNLWPGDHSVTVKAIGSDGQYSMQSRTAKLALSSVFDPENASRSHANSESESVAPEAYSATGDAQSMVDPASLSEGDAAQKNDYELVFSDEFNGASLNSFRWNAQLRWDGEFNGERYEYRVINGEDQFYVNVLTQDQEHRDLLVNEHNPFELDGSRLAIRAKRNPLKTGSNKNGFGPLREIAAQQTFLSGAISTYDKFSQKYGYFEARIKIPSHIGTFPAFWLYHQRRANEGTQRTEIDIMENLGHAPHYVYNSYHYSSNVSETYGGDAHFLTPKPEGQIYTGIDYSEEYHVYAVEWQPGNVKWFIDGEMVSELSDQSMNHEELYLIINMAMGGNWTNFPTNAGGLGRSSDNRYPTENDLSPENFHNPALEIDYVRVYKRR